MGWTQLFICITGLVGHLLIARQDKRGYWFWIVGNFAIIKLSLADGRYGMAGLFLVYTFISLHALRSWTKKRNVPEMPSLATTIIKKLKSAMNAFLRGVRDAVITSQVNVQPGSHV